LTFNSAKSIIVDVSGGLLESLEKARHVGLFLREMRWRKNFKRHEPRNRKKTFAFNVRFRLKRGVWREIDLRGERLC
jgi:hypothetical protein